MSLLQVLQIILALMFIMAGLMKLMMPKQRLGQKMKWANSLSSGSIKAIGVLEVLGSVGLVLPMWTSLDPRLSLLSGTGLAILSLIAFVFHLKRKEGKEAMMPFVLLLLTGYVAYSLINLL